jgi:anti-sigma regulatory factor (Ser/Thr protein kinase)
MPYLSCPVCGLSTYAIAGHSSVEPCPRCAAPLRTGANAGRGAPPQPALTRRFSACPSAAAAAREAIHSIAVDLGPSATETARLLVTELVSNALRHAGLGPNASIALKAFLSRSTALFHVRDDGLGFEPPTLPPEPNGHGEPDDYADLLPDGRGLLLVDRLSESWGVTRTPGATVWFEIRRAPAAQAVALAH